MAKPADYEGAADQWLSGMKAKDMPVILADGALHYYRHGYYTAGVERDDFFRAAMSRACSGMGITFSKEEMAMWRQVKFALAGKDEDGFGKRMDQQPLLACRNCVLDTETMETHEHSPDIYTTRFVNVEYDPKAKCPAWLATLERAFADKDDDDREELIQLLAEFFGVSVIGKKHLPRDLRKAVFLFGPSGTGKSSVADVLAELFPRDKIANATVRETSGRFGQANLLGMLAWIADEAVDGKHSASASLLKRIFDGQPLTIDQKYMPSVKAAFEGAVVFTANHALVVDEESDAVFRRVLPIEFTRRFSAKEAKEQLGKTGRLVPFLKERGEFPGILNWALKAARGAIDRGDYVDVESVRRVHKTWNSDRSPAADFLEQATEYDPKVYNSARVIAVAAHNYARRQHGARGSKTDAQRTVADAVKSVHPLVRTGKRVYMGGRQSYAYAGLKLNEFGLSVVKQAQEEGDFDLGEKLELNKGSM